MSLNHWDSWTGDRDNYMGSERLSEAKGAGEAASAWIRRFAPMVARGRVLDVACGAGRHAHLLRDLGHSVVAIDRDGAKLMGLAGEARILPVLADLEGRAPWPVAAGCCDAIVVTNYLHRPLFPELIEALAPGGLLIYETFARGNERFGRPRNPDFLLAAGELRDRVAGQLVVIAYEEGEVRAPRPAVMQRICARRD